MTEWNLDTAEWYATNYGEYPTNRLAVDALDLPMDAVVVDIGCGTGYALRHASLRVMRGRLIGIDPVPRMIEIARERTLGHPNSAQIEYRHGSAEKIPIEDESADFVFAFDSVDHWQDIEGGLGEICRILRRGGKLVIVKDGAVPGAAEARRSLVNTLERAGFSVAEQRELDGEGVSFTMWVCLQAKGFVPLPGEKHRHNEDRWSSRPVSAGR